MPLPQNAILVLAQPHPLSPDENVALDSWVREGGRLLLFADPMLTSDSHFALGDPRRPQDMIMLSPLLRHWGLELEFDAAQPAGERQIEAFGVVLPVRIAGRLRAASAANCRLDAVGIAANCVIGRGRVLIIADAAVLDGDDAGRANVLATLLKQISD